MKFIFLVCTFIFVVSCSKSESKKQETKSTQSLEQESGYTLPRIGFHKSVKLNYRLEFMYENMTINPNGNGSVLGDRPFYVEINEDNALRVSFYSSHDLKKVEYVDLSKNFETTAIKDLDYSQLLRLKVKEIPDFYREFTYGKTNFDSPDQDMLNKVFIIETQESDDPYLATVTMMLWVECKGGFKKSSASYGCGPGNLELHYKLVDYKLQKEI